jgi:hypothetical protein
MIAAISVRTAAFAALTLAIAGCASTSSEERGRAGKVRVVKDADAVRGCQPIGSVTDDDIQDLQIKALRLGGDVALVTFQSQRRGASGPAFSYGSSTYTTAEVYRCGSGR